MAETSVILFELLHGWNRVNIDYMTNNCQLRISLRDHIHTVGRNMYVYDVYRIHLHYKAIVTVYT